jgi:hypothetical protein
MKQTLNSIRDKEAFVPNEILRLFNFASHDYSLSVIVKKSTLSLHSSPLLLLIDLYSL